MPCSGSGLPVRRNWRPGPDRARVGLHRHRTLGRGARSCRRSRRPGRGQPDGIRRRGRRLDRGHRPGHARRLRRGPQACRPGARQRRSSRKRTTNRPGPAALGIAALADGSYLQAFTQLRGLFSEDGAPVHNIFSYLGVADMAAAAVRADRRMEGQDVLERALSHLNGMVSPRLEQLIARARGILACRTGPKPISTRRSPIPPGTSGPSSGPSCASTTPNGCGGTAGSTTPSPS